MAPSYETHVIEHRLIVKRAELLGPHLAELELLNRRRRRRLEVRERLGGVLIAVGTWIYGAPDAAPSATPLAIQG
jgi:hypothetical protein